MKDLTEGPVPRHVVSLAIPMMAGMLLQTLYFFVDLYFVSRLGDAAIAGVTAAGNVMFIAFFFTQMLGVATVAMVSQAVGRKDRAGANHAFNQAAVIAAVFALVTLAGGYGVADAYARFFAPDEAVREASATFLRWFIPNLFFQFPMVLMGSGLRGTGIVKPTMAVQALTVILNVIFAPVLVAGWGTGVPLGVAGAGLASSLAAGIGVVLTILYFLKLEHYIGFDRRLWRPHWPTWRRIADIGLPAGGEFGLMAIFVAIIYWAARDFGTEVQAGIGVGFRINQMLVVPGLAIAFAAAPIAGQNFGARRGERVRETFRVALLYCALVMGTATVVLQWKPAWFAGLFSDEAAVIASSVVFLQYLSWNFVPTAFSMTASSLFQAMGNTWPSFGASALRLVIFALPAVWMARQPWFELRYMFMLSVATVLLQAVVSYTWVQWEFRRRLGFAPERPQAG